MQPPDQSSIPPDVAAASDTPAWARAAGGGGMTDPDWAPAVLPPTTGGGAMLTAGLPKVWPLLTAAGLPPPAATAATVALADGVEAAGVAVKGFETAAGPPKLKLMPVLAVKGFDPGADDLAKAEPGFVTAVHKGLVYVTAQQSTSNLV